MTDRAPRTNMVHLAVEPELRRQIERFWKQTDLPSRTAAWKFLAWWALQQGAMPTPEQIEEIERGEAPWNHQAE